MATLNTLLVNGNGALHQWSGTQAFGDIDEGISSADGVEIADNTNSNSTLDTTYLLSSVNANFLSMDGLSWQVRYRVAGAQTNNRSLSIRIITVSEGIVLAAANSGGNFQTVANNITNTTLTNSAVTAFTYVNTSATKAQWDDARVELRLVIVRNMGGDTNGIRVDTLEFTGTYTADTNTNMPADSGSFSLTGSSAALVQDYTGPTVVLGTPADASSNPDTTPSFTFTGTGLGPLQYEVQIDPTANFNAITTQYQVKYIDLFLAREGTVDDNISIQFLFGSFTGTELGVSDTIDHDSLSLEFSWVRFTFATPITVSYGASGTKYYLVIRGSSARDTTNTYALKLSNVAYSGGGHASRDTGIFTSEDSTDLAFRIYDVDFRLLVSADPPNDINEYVHRGSAVGPDEQQGQSYTTVSYPQIDTVSSVDAGFVNLDDGGDTQPFTSGQEIQYTVQAGSELNADTTYYWRVRAYDASGFWGEWSEVRSFTTSDTGVTLTADSGSFTLAGTDTSLEQGYAVPAESGSYVLTGNDVGLNKGYVIVAESGSFSLDSADVIFLIGKNLTADSGSYSLNGIDASLEQGYNLTAESGSYTLAGIDAGLNKGYVLVAESNTYTLSGTDASLEIGRVLVAESGVYSLTGIDATLSTEIILDAESGSYALSGVDANLEQGYLLTGESDSYVLTGQDAGLRIDYTLVADSSVYTLTGEDASLLKGKTLTAEQGSFAFAGEDANILSGKILVAEQGTYSLSGETVILTKDSPLIAEQANFTLTGEDVSLEQGYLLVAESTSYALSGSDASLLTDKILTASSESYILSGVDVTLSREYMLVAEQATYSLSGTDASLLEAKLLSADSTNYVLTGTDATLTYAPLGSYFLNAEQGTFAVSEEDASLEQGYRLVAEQGSIALSGEDASLLKDSVISGEIGSFILSGNDASLRQTYMLAAEPASIVFSGEDGALLLDRLLSGESGGYVFTGEDASLIKGLVLSGDGGVYALNGIDAGLITGMQNTLDAEAGTFSLQGVPSSEVLYGRVLKVYPYKVV